MVLRPLAALALTALLTTTACTGSGSGDSGGGTTADVDTGGSVAAAEPAPDGVPSGTRFVDPGTSRPVDTAQDPRSTFALDVDTGSFSVARELLSRGVTPPPESVRLEEWVNSFDYDDPAPESGALGVRAETGLVPDGPSAAAQRVRVAVTTPELAEDDRPRAHVTLVVDRSGSMDTENRLGLVKESLGVLARELRPDDTVAVVSFDDEARPILPPTPVAEAEAVLGAVDGLVPGGSTNLEDGLRLGYAQARESFETGATNVVVLCSDGVANVGATLPESITSTVAEEGAAGIHLVTVGFGMGDYDDHLMEQLADRGDGFYSYVDTFDEAERLFGDELTTTLLPVAAEARAQVSFDPALVSSYRLLGYENRALADEDFDDLGVDAGELGPGHHVTALYDVRLADGVEPGQVIGSAELRWADPTDGAAHQASTALRSATTASPSAAFDLAGAVADTALWLRTGEPDPARAAALTAQVEALVEDGEPQAVELLAFLR